MNRRGLLKALALLPAAPALATALAKSCRQRPTVYYGKLFACTFIESSWQDVESAQMARAAAEDIDSTIMGFKSTSSPAVWTPKRRLP